MQPPYHYILFHKPHNVLSQFTPEAGHLCLKDFGPFPSGVYPVGRLDADSEGLLLLTNDNALKHRLADPTFGHPRTYLVQIERLPSAGSLERLREGIVIGGQKTKPAGVRLLNDEPGLPARAVPIRFRKKVPTAWIELILREGRNRQVRKMTAAVGHPTLRLVRTAIGGLNIAGLAAGACRPLSHAEVRRLRKSVSLPAL